MAKLTRPYNAMDVANHLVEKYMQQERPISNLLLLKILYYLQADFIRRGEGPLFSDTIEKWGYGPVIPTVYSYFKEYGAGGISSASSYIEVNEDSTLNFIDYKDRQLNSSDIDNIDSLSDEIYNSYRDKPFALVEQTHREPMWKDFEEQILGGKKHLKYDIEELQNYFREERNWQW
ncbi:Panacea domain-containing protein [Streptococcus orisratti]|uniref:Panacea domain-containing protein n=1 Tax=Streptococcus orisratti TaxID=114652 RepID=UPI003CFE3C66